MIFNKIIMGILISGLILFCGCITINVYNDHEIPSSRPLTPGEIDRSLTVRSPGDIQEAGQLDKPQASC